MTFDQKYLKQPENISFLKSSSNQEHFTFVFPDEKYEVPLLLAKYISPNVRKLKIRNPEINNMEIDVPNSDGIFNKILQYPFTKKLNFQFDQFESIYKIVLSLGNEKLYKKLISCVDSDEINMENVFQRIFLKNTNATITESKNREIKFLALNYYNIPSKKISLLPFDDIYSVCSSEYLKLSSEDELLEDIILNYFNKCTKEQFRMLIELVLPYNLSNSMQKVYIHYVRRYGLTNNILNSVKLCFKFEDQTNPQSISRYHFNDESIIKIKENIGQINLKHADLYFMKCGLFQFMYDNFSNEADFPQKYVKVTASSKTMHNPDIVLQFHSNQFWVSASSDTSPWIQFDISPHLLECKGYMLKSHNGPSYPKSWDFLAYDPESEKWEKLDCQTNFTGLCSCFMPYGFTISNPMQKKYSSFKFVMTGPTNNHDYVFCLSQVDFFGKYYYYEK